MLPEGLIHDDRILPVLTRLLGCVDTKMTEAQITRCFTGIVSGSMADSTPVSADTDSMLWLRMGEVTPVVAEGRPNVMACGIELEVNVEVGFLTCYPVEADGSPLSVEQNLEVTTLVNAAMMAMHRGINCCDWLRASPTGRKVDYDVTGWAPGGPQGGVVGGAWTLQVVV